MRRVKMKTGFTLVELLVTLGIILLLISLMLPALAAARESARAVACADRLRSFGQAMAIYANENDGLLVPPEQFPWHAAEVWAEPVLGADLVWKNKEAAELSDILVCPSDPYGGDPDPARKTRNSYLVKSYFSGYKIRFGITPPGWSASDVVVMGEKRPDAVGFTEASCYSLSTPDPQWWDVIDLVRHGSGSRRSNHLFFDLHVDNRDLLDGRPFSEVADPWPCFPGGTALWNVP